jgi:hypothetical protein
MTVSCCLVSGQGAIFASYIYIGVLFREQLDNVDDRSLGHGAPKKNKKIKKNERLSLSLRPRFTHFSTRTFANLCMFTLSGLLDWGTITGLSGYAYVDVIFIDQELLNPCATITGSRSRVGLP